MRTIYKYPIGKNSHFGLSMPKDAKILHVALQQGAPYIWAEVYTNNDTEVRHFQIIGTGWEIDFTYKGEYIATWQDDEFVWHLYETKTVSL